MLIGYARVSTHDQNLNAQEDLLRSAGCQRIYTDKLSGAKAERPGLADLKKQLRLGDTVVVYRLDRLGRSMSDLIELVNYFESEGVAFRSLHESIDTSTSTGKLVFHIFGALAEFERDLIKDRTNAGLAAARARGKTGGRPDRLSTDMQKLAVQIYHTKEKTIPEVCAMFGISKPTLYAYVKAHPQ